MCKPGGSGGNPPPPPPPTPSPGHGGQPTPAPDGQPTPAPGDNSTPGDDNCTDPGPVTNEYIFSKCCPSQIGNKEYQIRKRQGLGMNPKIKLCPDIKGWCSANNPIVNNSHGQDWGECTGWAADTSCRDSNGLKKFVETYIKLAPKEYLPYGPVIAAAVSHESGFAANSRSWDTCATTDDGKHGAVGLFQYDLISGTDPLPILPEKQFAQMFNTSSNSPNINNFSTKWMACNPAGATGGTGADPAAYKLALAEFKRQKPDVQYKERGELPNGQTCSSLA
jgi:hypothetical protein